MSLLGLVYFSCIVEGSLGSVLEFLVIIITETFIVRYSESLKVELLSDNEERFLLDFLVVESIAEKKLTLWL